MIILGLAECPLSGTERLQLSVDGLQKLYSIHVQYMYMYTCTHQDKVQNTLPHIAAIANGQCTHFSMSRLTW